MRVSRQCDAIWPTCNLRRPRKSAALVLQRCFFQATQLQRLSALICEIAIWFKPSIPNAAPMGANVLEVSTTA